MRQKQHIIVGMSGGVDSSLAAYLLQKAGHYVEGIFMKNWEEDAGDCPAALDFADAQAVCDKLKIPLRLVNFANEYWQTVFSYFLQEYQSGRTPNPDILCNKEIKFKAFLNYAKAQGADFIATGHYARQFEGKLYKGLDANKDQSYFLHAVAEVQLAQSLFPVGELAKTEVRRMASDLGLKTHDKKDSTGICFIGERKFRAFLSDYLPASPGKIMTLEGEEIGTHDGLMFYTIGQRQGLQIGGRKDKPEAPWYVADKDVKNNVLIVVQGSEHPALYRDTLIATHWHWINEPPLLNQEFTAKIRYRQKDQLCTVKPLGNDFQFQFKNPQRAVTPGQSIVLYLGERCLGGGVIC